MGVRSYEAAPSPPPRPAGPGPVATLVVVAIAWALLVTNGRAIGAADLHGVAGALLRTGLGVAGLVLDLDDTGRALVGKAMAALFAAIAAGALFAAAARRHPLDEARAAGLLLAVGTTLAAAAQAWSGEAPAACAVAVAVWLLARAEAEGDPGLGARALLPLGLAVALLPVSAVLAAVLGGATLLRFRAVPGPLLVWGAAGLVVALAGFAFGGSPAATPPPPVGGPFALLLSPAQGALAFAPIVLVGAAGIARALRPPRARHRWDAPSAARWLPAACALAAAGHLAWVGFGGAWATGAFWGPRLVAPAWPLLMLFLPEGFSLLRAAGVALAAVSVAAQALGAFAYDGRWDRLHRGPAGALPPTTWDLARSPIAFQVRERVLRLALPGLEDRRLVLREHPLVLGGPTGSFLTFTGEGPDVTGADATLGDVVLEGGARIAEGRLELRAPGDALFFRVREGARARRLELRVAGRGQGTLAVGEQTFWTVPRGVERAVAGSFRLRVPYFYPESGGADVRLALRGSGSIDVESVALVPPSEPENVIRLR